MAKIKLVDLATKMKITPKKLLFKLKSIGIPIKDESDSIDINLLKDILKGDAVAPAPREVIIRDTKKETAQQPKKEDDKDKIPSHFKAKKKRVVIITKDEQIKHIPEKNVEEQLTQSMENQKVTLISKIPSIKKEEIKEKVEKEEKSIKESDKKEESERRIAQVAKQEVVETIVHKPSQEKKEEKQKLKVEAASSGVVKKVQSEDAEKKVETKPKKPSKRALRKKRKEEQKIDRSEPITIPEGISVKELANKMNVLAKDILAYLLKKGLLFSINDSLPYEIAEEIVINFGFEPIQVSLEEEISYESEIKLEKEGGIRKISRPPVVTVMGHVDHGKTTLLDYIRRTKIATKEVGGKTQHIGAWKVSTPHGDIVFIDTPGHEAFTTLRARGAKVTDIVVLVVAADDGVKPQTIESINHAKAANATIIVAINKIDKPGIDVERVKQQLVNHGLVPEEWGGDIVMIPISAKTGEGVDELLEILALQSEMLELTASPDLPAKGTVLEVRKEVGKGIIATVIVQDGTLKQGDIFVCGASWGKVRAMLDQRGKKIKEAPAVTPVEVMGFQEMPEAGEVLQVVPSESKARSIVNYRKELKEKQSGFRVPKVSLHTLFEGQKEIKELNVIVKADVQGSIEAIKRLLESISTKKVRVKVIHSAVGAITANDIMLASSSNAVVVGFNVRPEKKASSLANQENVEVRTYSLIYDLEEDIKQFMAGLLPPVKEEVVLGTAAVKEIFKISKVGMVAGCQVTEGSIPRNAKVRVIRDGTIVYDGKIASLRRFKEDVSEVKSGFECGIRLENFQDIKPGDIIEAYLIKEVVPALE